MVSVIIPIHNILQRGHLRVFNSVYSLIKQPNLKEVIIVDSSTIIEYKILNDLLTNLNLDKVRHVKVNSDKFDKTLLLNKGVELADSEWVMCTDADYIFKNDFLEVCKKERAKDRILFKEVKMLPNFRVTRQHIDNWNFPNAPYNEWGHLANGGCQYASKEFFIKNPYPTMKGHGAMDNIMAYIAYNNGLKIKWIKDSEILHQWHKVVKFQSREHTKMFNENQKILDKYIKENNLPKLLKKTR